jgi:8-oxo-dGTP diphosphatase
MSILTEIIHRPGVNLQGKTVFREAVRGIIPAGSKLLMIYSSKNGDYKFPGGGLAPGESHQQALVREVLEEAGAQVTRIRGEYGEVHEYDIAKEKEFDTFMMRSRYFVCEVAPGLKEQKLDGYEVALGFTPVWIEVEEAIRNNLDVLQKIAPRWTRRDTFVLEHFLKSQSSGGPRI